MLLALTHGIKYGTKSSIATALGNTTASVFQASIAITGLGIVLTTSTLLFMLIKYIGALYLIYLGVKLFKSPFYIEEQRIKKGETSYKQLFNEAFIIAVANPKALVFFTALFPQFIREGQHNFLHYFLLVSVLGVIAFICMMIYSTSSSFIKKVFNKTPLSKYFGKVIGSIFISLGAGLALVRK